MLRALCEYHAATEAEAEEYQFARRMFNGLLEGWREPYVVACYYTYGLDPDKLIPALAARRAQAQWELYRRDSDKLDHTPSVAKRVVRVKEVR